jgi:tRNA(Ile2) C34 agmatinyltransferase TiaS
MLEREGLPVGDCAADFDAEQTSCPACSASFATAGRDRCPDCGLRFR